MLLEWLLDLPPWKPQGYADEGGHGTASAGPAGSATLADVSFNLIQGDLQPDMIVTCLLDGAPATNALTGSLAINLRWKRPDLTVASVPMVLVSASAGTVKRVWVAGDSDIVGTHYGQVVVTTASGELETFPSDGSHVLWSVFDKLTAGLPQQG